MLFYEKWLFFFFSQTLIIFLSIFLSSDYAVGSKRFRFVFVIFESHFKLKDVHFASGYWYFAAKQLENFAESFLYTFTRFPSSRAVFLALLLSETFYAIQMSGWVVYTERYPTFCTKYPIGTIQIFHSPLLYPGTFYADSYGMAIWFTFA